MPLYPFKCSNCGTYVEEVGSMKSPPITKQCDECGMTMDRVYTAPQVDIPTYVSEWNPGLGAKIRHKQDIVDAQNRIFDKTGSRPIEVGNDTESLKKLKPHRKRYPTGGELGYSYG